MLPTIVHVGYPKTATTTFQRHVFPNHPGIDYLGKFIPSYDYRRPGLFKLIDDLIQSPSRNDQGLEQLRGLVNEERVKNARDCVLLSSEAFIHPVAFDIEIVADRLHKALAPCKILITIREQVSLILSFYWMHGRHGQFLSPGQNAKDREISYPIGFVDWIALQESASDRNLLSILHYADVVACYAERFGPENVSVMLYEAMKAEPDRYAEELSNFLGVDPGPTKALLHDRHEHRSLDRREPWDGNDKAALSMLSAEASPQTGEAGDFVRTSDRPEKDHERIIRDLRDRYRAGNTRLLELVPLPIRRYGYAT